MADYSHENLAAMQEDALNRVREMQRRARQKVEQNKLESLTQQTPSPPLEDINDITDYNKFDSGSYVHKSQTENKKHTDNKIPYVSKKSNEGNMISSLANKVFSNIDSDLIFLLVLMMMLQEQNANNELILAIFYIMT